MIVKIYAKPDCLMLEATKRLLNRDNVQYLVVDVSVDEEALTYALSLGYTKLPVVIAGDEHWSGFRPEKITKLKKFGRAVQE